MSRRFKVAAALIAAMAIGTIGGNVLVAWGMSL